jgi:hypothetical protein
MENLGRKVAAAQDEVLAATDAEMDRVRERLLAHDRSSRTRWVGAAVAAAAVAAGVVFALRTPRPMSFRVEGAHPAVEVGAFVAVPRGETTPVRFSDGSTLTLESESAARIVDVGHDGARVVLEHGRVRAAVRHRESSKWEIGVGPFEVRVTGTRFRLSWDPVDEEFELGLEQGSVLVSGPLVGKSRRVATGETLRVSIRDARLELTREGAVADADAPVEPAPEASADPIQGTLPPHGATTPRAPPTWRELARDQKWPEALGAAEAMGFQTVCERAGAEDLALLGNAARLSGSRERATLALGTLRRRFPQDPRASDAAFYLGRMAPNDAEAARLFSAYLAERPSGTFAREAAGRLVEALHRSHDPAAVDAARTYLTRYPNGPFARLARSIAP